MYDYLFVTISTAILIISAIKEFHFNNQTYSASESFFYYFQQCNYLNYFITYILTWMSYLSNYHLDRCNYESLMLTPLIALCIGTNRIPLDWCHYDSVAGGRMDSSFGPACSGLFFNTRWFMDLMGRGDEGIVICYLLNSIFPIFLHFFFCIF